MPLRYIQPEVDLLVFDGMCDGYLTPESWEAALLEWHEARSRWASAHGVPVADLPSKIGDAPWDPDLI